MSSNEQSGSENIKCVVRCRPLNEKEKGLGTKCITISSDSKVVIVENKNEPSSSSKSQFAMDMVFNEDVAQDELFREVGEPILQSFLGGYNCTIFCYGQTGAGKTHTMMGPLDQLYENQSPSQGLIPRIIHYIFNEKEKVNNIITNNTTDKCKKISITHKICVMELYQEQIIDLLYQNPNKNAKNEPPAELKIKEDPKKGMYIQGITEMEIKNAKEAKDLILMGLRSRHVAATEMNAESSRSHLLFSIFVSTSYITSKGGEVKKSSRLHLIDLAGSERQKKTKAQGERMKEACMINKSLSTLGNVINALVENYDGKNKYIPFRDSKLTYFLKDSLGGNSKTTIVANISCSLIQISETISTLKFVQRAKMIKNKATLNMSVQENIEALQEEIKKLKNIIAKGEYPQGEGVGGGGSAGGAVTPENFICPICHNQPIEVNQEKLMATFKSDIVKLTETVIKNLSAEDTIKTQFKNLNNEIVKSGTTFYDLIDNYKKEYEQKLKQLNEQIRLVNEFYEKAKTDMEAANKKIIEYKHGDSIDRIMFENVSVLNGMLTKLVEEFKGCSIDKFQKIEAENTLLKTENKISQEVKRILDNQKKRLDIENSDINKNSKNIQETVNKFVNTNDQIKKFFADNFLGQSTFKGELVLLEKTKYDMLNFQIDEEKMTSKSLRKQIEAMESENYLVNIDILRLQSQIDAYKARSKRFESINEKDIEEKSEENKSDDNSDDSDSKSEKEEKPKDKDKDKDNKDKDKDNKDKDNKDKKNSKEVIGFNSNSESEDEKKNKAKKNDSKDQQEAVKKDFKSSKNIKKIPPIDTSRKESENKKKEKEGGGNTSGHTSGRTSGHNTSRKHSKKPSINGKKKSKHHKKKKTPRQNSSDDDSENDDEIDDNICPIQKKGTAARRGIFRASNIDPSVGAKEKTKNFNQQLVLSTDKIEVIKMKERLDELNEDISTKILENEELKQQVYELNCKINELNIKIEENEAANKSLKEEIEGLDTTNEIFEKQIFELSNYKKDINVEIGELINMVNSEHDKNEELVSISNSIVNSYQKKCDDLLNQIKNLDSQNNTNKNNLEKLNKDNQTIIDEILALCDENNKQINSLGEKYTNEMNNIEKYYSQVVKGGDAILLKKISDIENDLSDSINSIDLNEKNITVLNDHFKDIYNSLLVKLELKEKDLNILKKEKDSLITEKKDSDEKNSQKIQDLEKEISSYKNKIMTKDNIIQLHLEQELMTNQFLEETEKLLLANNKNINQLNEIYNNEMSLFIKYYNSVIIIFNKKIIRALSENDKDIDEIKALNKKNENSLEELFSKNKQITDIYYEKSYSLLKVISHQDILNRALKEKISTFDIKEKQLENHINLLEKENTELRNEKAQMENMKDLNTENNSKNKKELEKAKEQLSQLNDQIMKYIEQLKQKDNIINKLKQESQSINLQIKEFENKSTVLGNNLDNKNNIINAIQNDNSRQNKIIGELNDKNIALIKELQEEKNKHSNIKVDELNTKINELNERILFLVNEVAIKDETINKLNSDHSDLNEKIKEIINDKNDYLIKLTEKDNQISQIQNNTNELNQKILENNQKIFDLLNENKTKSKQLEEMNYSIQNTNEQLKEKDNMIKKLNNKIKIQENLLSSNKKNRRAMALSNSNNSFNNENYEDEDYDENYNECGENNNNHNNNNISTDDKLRNTPRKKILNINLNKDYIIEQLKKKIENLYKEKLKNIEENEKINTKYFLTEILVDLPFNLVGEFNTYQSKLKSDKPLQEVIDKFIVEKIEKSNKEMKTAQNKINNQLLEKKKIQTDLLQKISDYLKNYDKINNTYIKNLNDLITFLDDDNKNISLSETMSELIEDMNEIFINKIKIGINTDMNYAISKVSDIINNKKAEIDQIIKAINDSYNKIITLEEIFCDEKIIFYNYKNQNGASKVNGDENDKLFNIWSEYKNNIKSLKNRYRNILRRLSNYKNNLLNDNLCAKQASICAQNIIDSQKNNSKKKKGGEKELEEEKMDDDMVNQIKKRVETNKQKLIKFLNQSSDNSNNKNTNNKNKVKYANSLNICKNVPDLSKFKRDIDSLLNMQNISDKQLNENKLNMLLLKTLSNHYNNYKVFLTLKVLEDRNKILEEKLKIILGDNYNINILYREKLPEVIWSPSEVPRLKSEILIMRENKIALENDIKSLRMSFELMLKGNGKLNDNQLLILFRMKEENKKLRQEIKVIKEKNRKMQEKLKEIDERSIKIKDGNNNIACAQKILYNQITSSMGGNDTSMFDKSDLTTKNTQSGGKRFNNNNINKTISEPRDYSVFINDLNLNNGYISPKASKKKYSSVEKYKYK